MGFVAEVKDLEIRYGMRKAVKGISFQVSPGESIGLLGANGAGKSSTLRALLGMQRFSHGSVSVFDNKPGSIKTLSMTGFAPEEGAPPDYFTGKEYLSFIQRIKALAPIDFKEVDELLSWFEIDPQKKIREYSKGMKRRLTLAQAFLGKPRLLILDEPLNGLDPLIIVKLREWLNSRKNSDTSLIYSSHILSEVEKVCSRAIILKEGKVILDSSIPEIVSRFGSVEGAFTQKSIES